MNAALALQAGTTSFADWFPLSANRRSGARAVREEAEPLGPRACYVGQARAPVTASFANEDVYVPKASADAFFAGRSEAEGDPLVRSGHGLSEQAVRDRQDWLAARLGLVQPRAARSEIPDDSSHVDERGRAGRAGRDVRAAIPAAAGQSWAGRRRATWCRRMKGLPTTWDVKTKKNVKWVAALGSQSYGNPVVAGGKIFVGTNNEGLRDPKQARATAAC